MEKEREYNGRAHQFFIDLTMAYDLPNIIRKMKSRGMIWAGQVAQVGDTRNTYIDWKT
jgi:hypothetical protein